MPHVLVTSRRGHQRTRAEKRGWSVSRWPATKASRVLGALLRIGWREKRITGSHRVLKREGWPNVVFAYHEGDEIGPRALARLAKDTGLSPEDL